MAYTHSKYEVQMLGSTATTFPAGLQRGGVLLGTTGLQGTWAPGYVPHIIRGAAVIPHVTTALTNAGVYGFEADISTPGTPTRLFTIRQPTALADAVHKAIYYTPTYYIEIAPGSIVDFRVTAAGSGMASVILYVEPRWENPTNVTSMRHTT